jgi:hypothetical protein
MAADDKRVCIRSGFILLIILGIPMHRDGSAEIRGLYVKRGKLYVMTSLSNDPPGLHKIWFCKPLDLRKLINCSQGFDQAKVFSST